ncbi:Anion exchange protein 2 [Orchesella cincta]|uniref:Anion exchange protein n=1 Tax=Orchesella cincta TaxID=48709 RepID=A0A1D2MG08_ORCCI|nr:Anion exchange protein 2 [Orchesella cincta]
MDPSKNPDPNKSPPSHSSSSSPTKGAKAGTKVDEHGENLSEMIEEVLNPRHESMNPERFNMSLVHGTDAGAAAAPDPRRFDEKDYQSHRRESFPHIHHPLRPLHSRSLRKKLTSPIKHASGSHGTSSPIEPGVMGVDGNLSTDEPSSTATSTPSKSVSEKLQCSQSAAAVIEEARILAEEIDAEPEEAYESCPLLGDTEMYTEEYAGESGYVHSPQSPSSPVPGPFDDLIEPVKKVQFEIGGSSIASVGEAVHEKRKHSRKHSHHHNKYEDPIWRLRQGSELAEDLMQMQKLAEADYEMEIASDMGDMDRDGLADHRFGDNKGFRRHRFYFKATDDTAIPVTIVAEDKPSKYDHQPHDVYVELDVLSVRGHLREWKETARFIKYEEDLEEGADRWGRPHIASLSFHSLINLRRLIEAGVTILDLEERDLPGVAYRVVAAMAINELISDEEKPMVMKSLLSKHKHVNDDERPWRFHLRRNTQSGSLTSLHAMLEDKRNRNGPISNVEAAFEGLTRRSSAASRLGNDGSNDFQYSPNHKNGHVSSPRSVSFRGPFSFATSATDSNLTQQKGQHVAINLAKFSLSNLSEEDVKWITNKENILRRIPLGSECSIVLVGQDDSLQQPALAFVRLAEAVIMPNTTELPIPVRFIFIVLGPSSIDLDYKEIGRSISTLMSNTVRTFSVCGLVIISMKLLTKPMTGRICLKASMSFLMNPYSPPGDWDGELFPFEELREKSQALRRRKERRRSLAKGLLDPGDGGDEPPHKDDDYDPLQRTRVPFGGLINEAKRRYPKYCSDIRDGFNTQTLASIIFIYFACVSGAIAFGGILSEKTESHIGISETLMASAGAGIIFALFSGQPLIIVGTTGPLLLFDHSLYKFCKSASLDYLGFRLWVGFWVAVIGTIVVAAEGSVLARYFTRFVQEIYSALISLLFVYDAIHELVQVYQEHPLQMTYGECNSTRPGQVFPSPEKPNTALLTTILCLGTFIIAYLCRALRDSDYFTLVIRKFLGNFAVPIAIIAMVGTDRLLVNHTETEKLDVPQGLSNSKPRASWIIDITNVPVGMVFLAIIPAFLVFILIFMETSICGRLVAKKDNKLKKGGGFHLDIFLLGIINAGAASVGGCWVCAATVRAVAHTTSLVVFSTNNPPGEKPAILGANEQRVSGLVISVMLGLSVYLSPALVLIPMAVLFGVFLYMGISSMRGVQFFERIALLFKQVSNHPQVPYVRRVRTSKMHLFTVIQVCCLALLWGVKSSPLALAVPFVLLLLVPFRMFVMTRAFKPHELAALDSDGADPPVRNSLQPKDLPFFVSEDGNMNKVQQNGNGVVIEGKDFRSIW